ncbi:CASP protein 1E1 [Spatholobus suberectus]|nr:CASP protein 1E1 [Spatholobus suberectus]
MGDLDETSSTTYSSWLQEHVYVDPHVIWRAEGQSKGSFNVMEGSESKGREFVGTCDLLLRLLAFVLTLVAAVVVGADKQTAIVPIKLVDSMPPLHVPVSAKWHYLSAFVYFVGANAIACAYATLSLLLTLANKRKGKGMETLITVLDALMVALLFSGNGAAIAVGILGLQGNSHVHWNKVCNVFGKFCDQVAASLFISLLGSIAFLSLLVVPPVLRLKRAT